MVSVSTASRAPTFGRYTIATAQEVLLIDGFEEARYGPLQELIFYSGNAQGTLRAIPFGNIGVV